MRFVGQFFLPLLNYVQASQACAIVDPIAAQSWRNLTGSGNGVVFLPFEPAMEFAVDLITPVVRTRSKLAEFFEARLTEALEELEQKAGIAAK